MGANHRGPYSRAAPDLYGRGLSIIPVGGVDGKRPLVRFGAWKRQPPAEYLGRTVQQYPDANVGVVCGLSGVTVVDVDRKDASERQFADLVENVIRRFGDTPMKVCTPGGGLHLWYAHGGERSINRLDDMQVDIKAHGGFVVAPPSLRPTGDNAGRQYRFLEGNWDDLARLPSTRTGTRRCSRTWCISTRML